ncbi:aldehyde dehydrogenase family protein [Collimonas arenae]|uniref:Aldehyde dehydrogenase n=1 Tax=Collimonas arenae TaxID=279058 RepID=A0A127PNL9_9BURK|nr:aldehyde dehydrogenase family protein [Collimonas arenae]AMO99343.1 aldehyde dehydrogenase family protein [Collimonas arenae]AMP09247.1 aldehyde dehydrogenase family protein [Collimonas arenae]
MNTVTTQADTELDLTRKEILRVFDAQHATALRLRQSTKAERLQKIRKLKAALLAHRDAVIAAGQADFGKPAAEVELTEILPVIAEANDAIRKLGRWMKPKKVWPSRMMIGTSGYTQYEPKGRVLIVAPWNYPVNLSLGPLVSALAAGNTAIIKPSEMTPHASAVIGQIIREVFSEDEVAMFEGDAPVAQALLDLPFDHIFFTGSPVVGKIVMAAAAKHLTSVTLELGGKSPTIVDETADLKAAAQNILWAKYTNNGQTCIAPDHIYVHASVKDEFLEHCRAALEAAYGKTAQQADSPDLARIVNQRHTARIKNLLDDATSRGARVVTGGLVDESQRYIAPTLIDGIPDDAKIMSEEIFGPLLPIIAYEQLDSVIARINADPKPLALYIWSRKQEHIARVMQQTTSGGACINHCVVQFLHGNLPFGGVNNSGIGSGHGHHGFLAFSHERAVVRTRIMLASMFYPPYSGWTRKLVALFIKTV